MLTIIDVMCVFGTRPELVKLAPVIQELRARGLATAVVATGQHVDLLDSATLARVGAVQSLGIESDGNVLKFSAQAERALRKRMLRLQPRVVLVQGDTMSAFAGANAAAALGVPIAHVEAGLRSGDDEDPWPEELIRKAITQLATWHYAPTMRAVANIDAERTRRRNCLVMLTGNTSVDALVTMGVAPQPEASPTVLVTLHRRELRERKDVGKILERLALVVSQTPHVSAIWPLHPAMANIDMPTTWSSNFKIVPPMPHGSMLRALAEARGVLTDSGGVVEEAATLGVPTAVLRNATDRPEAEEAGIARRFPTTTDGVTLAWHTLASRDIARTPSDVFGTGVASIAIAKHLAQMLR